MFDQLTVGFGTVDAEEMIITPEYSIAVFDLGTRGHCTSIDTCPEIQPTTNAVA